MIEARAPLEIMPLFIRSGSIVPMGPKLQHSGEKPHAPLELRIYRGADGIFELYEDEGDNYNYETGNFAVIRIHWDDQSSQLVLEERMGGFPGMAGSRIFHIILVREGHGTGLEETVNFDRMVEYHGERMVVDL